jgi:hypothetical protein
MLNRQLMFDDAAKHLARQRAKATSNNLCQYRTVAGLKCIIGAMIPAKNYRANFDGVGGFAGDLAELPEVLQSLDPKYGTFEERYGDEMFAVALRNLHDKATAKDWNGLRREWFMGFQNFARVYGLDFTIARQALCREDDVPDSPVRRFDERNCKDYVPALS